MIPVVTPDEMAAIDAAAPEPVEMLIDRAGAAVAREAIAMLGGTYGRRVVVVHGKGNNGADGRSAARRLRSRGVKVTEIAAADLPPVLPPADLLIDAAYGTGFRGQWQPPSPPEVAMVLAVDIPSGIDGLTGVAHGEPWSADRTITFAALKPGLLFHDGPSAAGEVTVADIGLDTSPARANVVEPADVARWLPGRSREAHKWQAACWVIAGSPGMTGAAVLSATGAQRIGAGYVRLSVPGLEVARVGGPVEAVGIDLAAEGWADPVLDSSGRVAAIAVGPGLGRSPEALDGVRTLVRADAPFALVVDGDGLHALVDGAPARPARDPQLVLTPHDGELVALGGDPKAPDRLAEVRLVARQHGAVVLAKGPATVVAHPDGRVLIANSGDARLATAGTGDVLTGAIVGLLAQGVAPFEAAAAAAHLHGRAGALAWRRGLVASDVAAHLPAALAELPET